MGHPDFDNQTPFAFEPLFVTDEECRPTLTPIIKATYSIGAGGVLELADEQRPVDFAGSHWGDPETTSLKVEPETAFTKPASDVILVAHAHAPHLDATEMDVRIQVGEIRKVLHVTGDRIWEKGLVGPRMTEPEPFETIPLIWERAFGGWDVSPEKEKKHGWEPRNPIGVGFRVRRSKLEEGLPLPNIEHPDSLLTRYSGKSQPAGCGFVSPNWEPRAGHAGTYDEEWESKRAPLLPRDFSRQFFNAAPADQIVEGYLKGDEGVVIEGVRPEGVLRFALPRLECPRARVSLRSGEGRELNLSLDTLVIDAEAMEVVLIWRAMTTLRSGPLDVAAVSVSCANAPVRAEAPEPESNVTPLFGSDREPRPATQGA